MFELHALSFLSLLDKYKQKFIFGHVDECLCFITLLCMCAGTKEKNKEQLFGSSVLVHFPCMMFPYLSL